ncbi:LOW QUALITY PROTEIN: hypothetical protein HID58_047397 [Brassica napus]|uniref:Leucine-rich repeat-containing N-terminal plant-type domain-containing protein n=1 Tax=Brassica napus TaxID=3708 RepID=A0ABQ8AZ80_BRANA|nr:LOW QUALITY PROTEIN: hypothetical protein HID58_047397 [Brassica napus]
MEGKGLLKKKLDMCDFTVGAITWIQKLPALWTDDTKSDCCLWEGVVCNQTSLRMTKIAFGTLDIKNNSLLNLSLMHPFEDVRCLNLSKSRFSFLDREEDRGWHEQKDNQFAGLFVVEGYKSLGRLRNLEILDFTSNKFNKSIFPYLSSATSLTTLFLRDNHMDGPFPAKELRDLINLELLDLSRNRFNGTIPVVVHRCCSFLWWTGSLINSMATYNIVVSVRVILEMKMFEYKKLSARWNLKALDLSDNKFTGSMELQGKSVMHSRSCKLLEYLHLITTGICNLKNMEELDLSRHKLFGQFPSCLTSLSGLRVLDLSSNQMTGKLPSALSNLESLEYLSLFDNNFEGFFSLGSLANLSELRVLKLGSKSNSLQVESEGSWKPKFQLKAILLGSCNLNKVPHFLLYQKGLHQVDLSDNKISGNFPSWLMENNTELKNIGWILPQLVSMNISGNGFQGNLPFSLGNMKDNSYVDLSHDSFEGKIPRDFLKGCYSMQILTLSHNTLSGEVFPEGEVPYSNISDLLLDNNHFRKIGQGLRSLESLVILDISNNSLTVVIPSWIGELPSLVALLLSNNMLEGEIPMSLFNKSNLWLLDLSANILSGGIPPHIESSLTNNMLSGNIPEFINTQSINIILLRGNNLTGPIPRQLCDLRNIHLLDLANNKLNGSIPACLSNTSFGLGSEEDAFSSFDFSFGVSSSSFQAGYDLEQDSTSTKGAGRYFSSFLVLDPFNAGFLARSTRTKIEFEIKHRYDSYIGENLQLLFGMDLSKNELSGEIPVELGALMELQALNLSHNKLSGVIPESFQGLKNVESLDLSSNWLQGRIPPQLAELSSLAVFNVSFNNLSGVIPQGRQFNTFDSQSFLGNPFLCGQQTNTSCGGNSIHSPDNVVKDEEGTIDMESFYWSFAAAYVTILVGLFTSLSFNSPWSRFWFYKVEVSIHKEFLRKYLICVILLLGQLHGYKSCVNNERKAFKRVIEIAFGELKLKESSLLNLSLLHPFEEVRSYKSLGKLRNLEILDLSSNKFSNSMFPFLNAATASRADKLGTAGPQVIYPEKLKALDLSDNEFSGSIELQGKFKFLYITSVGICKLKNMQELDLSRNKLVSQFPICLTGLTGLRVLDLSSNEMTGKLPSALSNLVSLEYLSLFDNNFEGLFSLGSLSNLPKLRVIKLGSKSKSLQVVESEGSWKPKFQLNAIVLGSSNLDKFPHFLRQQKGLREVDLSNNKISGNFPTWLMENNRNFKFCLSIMNISGNGFQGNLPFSLSNMTEILYLDISHNNFQGKIPRGFLKECYFIGSLKLSHKRFSGEVFPEEVPAFSGISELFMDNNQFTGNIGKGLGNLQYLLVLDISNSSLLGVIPNCIGQLPQLTALLLSNNSLEGNIPTSLFNMSNLYLLDLSANRLSGDIPPHIISAMPSIVFLQDNNLSGIIPDTLLMNIVSEYPGVHQHPKHWYSSSTGSYPSPPVWPKNHPPPGSCQQQTELTHTFMSWQCIIWSGEMSTNPFIGGIMEKSTRTKIEFATKHRYDSYMGGNLELLIGMDLSENELSALAYCSAKSVLRLPDFACKRLVSACTISFTRSLKTSLSTSSTNPEVSPLKSTQFPDRIITSSASTLFRKSSSSSNRKFSDLFVACLCSVSISEHSSFSSCCALITFLADDFINGFVVASTDASFSTRSSLTVSNTIETLLTLSRDLGAEDLRLIESRRCICDRCWDLGSRRGKQCSLGWLHHGLMLSQRNCTLDSTDPHNVHHHQSHEQQHNLMTGSVLSQ